MVSVVNAFGVAAAGHVSCAAGVLFGVGVSADGYDAGVKHNVMVLQVKSWW